LASITRRKCFSVAPTAAIIPNWRSRRWATTAKPARRGGVLVDPSVPAVVQLSAQSDEPAEAYLVSVAPDGSDMRPITNRPGVGRLLDPVWSPDGTRIASARQVSGKFDLFRCAPDGSGLTSLTHTSEADGDWPAWSPEGTKIAFARYGNGFEKGEWDLCLANVHGTSETLLLGGEQDDSSPAWSPDARRIAFIRNGHLAVIGQGGTALRWVTSGDELTASRPSSSADGSRIVFPRDPGSVLLVGLDSGLVLALVDRLATGAVWEPP
jgi:Tol biopolymer transport system component